MSASCIMSPTVRHSAPAITSWRSRSVERERPDRHVSTKYTVSQKTQTPVILFIKTV